MNLITIKQQDEGIEVRDDYVTVTVPYPEETKHFDDEIELFKYIVQYSQDTENPELTAILDAIIEIGCKTFIEAIPYEHETLVEVIRKMGFLE